MDDMGIPVDEVLRTCVNVNNFRLEFFLDPDENGKENFLFRRLYIITGNVHPLM